MTAFHKWLLKNRPCCEIGSCMIPPTRITQVDGKDKAVCDAHWRANHPSWAKTLVKAAEKGKNITVIDAR